MFVLSLKRGMYLYQFTQYAWTHMTILVVIMPTSFFVSNVFQGIIWYILPAMLIIVNDIFAYLAGEVVHMGQHLPAWPLFIYVPSRELSLFQILILFTFSESPFPHPHRLFLRAHPPHPAQPQEDLGGLHWRICMHPGLCFLFVVGHCPVQLADLPQEGKCPQELVMDSIQ